MCVVISANVQVNRGQQISRLWWRRTKKLCYEKESIDRGWGRRLLLVETVIPSTRETPNSPDASADWRYQDTQDRGVGWRRRSAGPWRHPHVPPLPLQHAVSWRGGVGIAATAFRSSTVEAIPSLNGIFNIIVFNAIDFLLHHIAQLHRLIPPFLVLNWSLRGVDEGDAKVDAIGGEHSDGWGSRRNGQMQLGQVGNLVVDTVNWRV